MDAKYAVWFYQEQNQSLQTIKLLGWSSKEEIESYLGQRGVDIYTTQIWPDQSTLAPIGAVGY
jgi:hypothetical protein